MSRQISFEKVLQQLNEAQPTIGQDIGSSHPMAAPHSCNHGDVVRGVISRWLDDQDVMKGQLNSGSTGTDLQLAC